ncbi:hypothetical protein PR003_g18110 [Phytophthora rubi]|uniref:Secreted protein n=1 Tax=Phytophthora rubi TaxID=129364 RepID=A0A6A4EAE8_9STRA|nr:hypothetical protein PR003_g18110 [Phytophthora rubi]
MVGALAALLYFSGPIATEWCGRRLMVDLRALRGSVSQTYIAAESAQHGTFCGEWLPYVSFASLRLYSACKST